MLKLKNEITEQMLLDEGFAKGRTYYNGYGLSIDRITKEVKCTYKLGRNPYGGELRLRANENLIRFWQKEWLYNDERC